MTENKYPLYPPLTEEAEKEAQQIIERFKEKIRNVLIDEVEYVMGKIYSDIILYINSDSWTNFRNEIMDGFKNYDNRKIQAEYDFKEIRRQIYKEFKDDVIKDLNQDNLNKIKELEEQIEHMANILNKYD